jgi:iron uptake system component EfeO
MPKTLPPGRAALPLAALLIVAAAGCGSGGSHRASVTSTTTTATRLVTVDVSAAGCAPSATRLGAGPATFQIRIEDGNTVAEVELLQRPIVLAELENLSVGRSRASFTLVLPPGKLELYCPGGRRTLTPLTVTGTLASRPNPGADAAVERYRTWVQAQSQRLVNATLTFADAVRSGDLARARALYPRARVYYERVEPIAESFSTLDKRIDARAGDVPAASWTGFHPIEKRLWVSDTTNGAGKLATQLVADVTAVNSVAGRLKLTPAQIANGAVQLLNEVSANKITGEEERYSHIDLVDFEANVRGARQAFVAVRPLLAGRDGELATEITARFADVEQALQHYRKGGTFVRYTTHTKDDTRHLSAVVDALAEPLSRVSAAIITGS